ncbi:unnamed protein product [Phaedon cochleariae]|uniref:HAT C-terminal dimerisation domain-containing protein n=1 Tax=Phaedon cochleariae TaxID=80249 RepID=A0A9N9SF43_PHACE|nr:unnamed protein product [Phaedon cochleariae]
MQLPQIWCALKFLTTNDYNAETVATAKSIMGLIDYKFICTLQIWDQVLESVDRVNVALQSKTIAIDKASELIKGLIRQIQNIRETIDNVFEKAEKVCVECEIEDYFPEKRKKRVKRQDLGEISDAGYDITYYPTAKRFEKLHNIHHLFNFLTIENIAKYPAEELKKHAADLSIKYSADINNTEFWAELDTLKCQAETTILFNKCDRSTSLGLLKAIVELDLKDMFPNVVVAIKIFLTMPVTVASCERSFRRSYRSSHRAQKRLFTALPRRATNLDLGGKVKGCSARDTTWLATLVPFSPRRATNLDLVEEIKGCSARDTSCLATLVPLSPRRATNLDLGRKVKGCSTRDTSCLATLVPFSPRRATNLDLSGKVKGCSARDTSCLATLVPFSPWRATNLDLGGKVKECSARDTSCLATLVPFSPWRATNLDLGGRA